MIDRSLVNKMESSVVRSGESLVPLIEGNQFTILLHPRTYSTSSMHLNFPACSSNTVRTMLHNVHVHVLLIYM